jgi:small subunit ribosomal protein S4
MGDPKKIRKKYQTPMHPWQASRIEEERALRTEYGLGSKKEIWKMVSTLTLFKDRAKKLLAQTGKQAELEQKQLVGRLAKLGLVSMAASVDDILGLSVKDVMNRRLQTLMVRKHLARTAKQARQMIIHRHVVLAGKVVTSPSHLVSVDEEAGIGFVARSKFLNEQHPERFSEAELEVKRQKEEAKKKKVVKEEPEVLAFDEKEIAKAEVLVGEKVEANS